VYRIVIDDVALATLRLDTLGWYFGTPGAQRTWRDHARDGYSDKRVS
jgi:hypothetical protein